MTDLRTAAQQALEACEQRLPLKGQAAIIDELNNLRAALAQQAEPRNQCGETCERAKLCATCARTLAQQDEPLNLSDPAIQKRLAAQWGYVPAAQESVPAAVVGTQSDVWRGYNGQWQAPGEPIKTVQMLRDLPMGTLLYTAPPQRKPLTEGRSSASA